VSGWKCGRVRGDAGDLIFLGCLTKSQFARLDSHHSIPIKLNNSLTRAHHLEDNINKHRDVLPIVRRASCDKINHIAGSRNLCNACVIEQVLIHIVVYISVIRLWTTATGKKKM